MTFIHLCLLVTQSFALEYYLPSHLGGKTDYSELGWRALLGQISPDVKLGRPPTGQLNIAEEPTCFEKFPRCSTTYFGKQITLKLPDSAHLWIKWHEDATPLSCDNPEGCIVSSPTSVADLTAQSHGFSLAATISAEFATKNDSPIVNGQARALSFRYADTKTIPKTLVSTRTLTAKCSHNHMCYIQTGTLMLTMSGMCDSKPLIVCDHLHFPCESFSSLGLSVCSQWDAFTEKHCHRGVPRANKEVCSMTVAVTADSNKPISYQVFEQVPLSGKESIVKRDNAVAESPFSELPDGSSGLWMAWNS